MISCSDVRGSQFVISDTQGASDSGDCHGILRHHLFQMPLIVTAVQFEKLIGAVGCKMLQANLLPPLLYDGLWSARDQTTLSRISGPQLPLKSDPCEVMERKSPDTSNFSDFQYLSVFQQ